MFLLDQNYQETDLGTLPLLSVQRGIVRIFGSCRLKCLGSRQGLVLVFFFVIAASSDVLENVLRKCAWEAQYILIAPYKCISNYFSPKGSKIQSAFLLKKTMLWSHCKLVITGAKRSKL